MPFNTRVEDSKTEPIHVIVERGKIVDIQHHLGLDQIGHIIISNAIGARVGGALRPHFPDSLEIQTKPRNSTRFCFLMRPSERDIGAFYRSIYALREGKWKSFETFEEYKIDSI